jgi:TctA family transporter
MMAREGRHAWLDAAALRVASDVTLGCVLAIAGAVAIANVEGHPWEKLDHIDPWFMPGTLGCALIAIGVILIVRGIVRPAQPAYWTARGLLIVVPAVLAAIVLVQQWSMQFMLSLGPAEFATLAVLELVVVMALVRGSLLRSVGLALFGLLLSTIGTDIASGLARFTMGSEDLIDGLALPILASGLIVVADGVLGFLSPSLLIATYARRIDGLPAPRIGWAVDLAMRAIAMLLVAACAYAAFLLNASLFDVGMLFLFAVIGIACSIFDWSRLTLIAAFTLGVTLEEQIRRALLISRGDLATFVRWPISTLMVGLACAILATAATLSIRSDLARQGKAA